jgi:hypothetical protein
VVTYRARIGRAGAAPRPIHGAKRQLSGLCLESVADSECGSMRMHMFGQGL